MQGYSFFMDSVYMPWDRDMNDILQRLINIKRLYNGIDVLIMGDFNCKSRSWYSTRTDQRGLELEDFLVEQNLFVINMPGHPFTFSTINGEDNIDVTLASGNLMAKIEGWSVMVGEVQSDHRLIQMKIKDAGMTTERVSMVNLSKINIELACNMATELQTELAGHLLEDKSCIDAMVVALTRGIGQILEDACEWRYPVGSQTPWWNNRLDHLKAMVKRARRRLQRQRRRHLEAVDE